MSLYLSQLFLNAASRDVRRDLGDPGQMHRTLLKAFPAEAAPCDFRNRHGVLYRVEVVRDTSPSVLIQSLIQPDWAFLQNANGYLLADPEWKEISQRYEAIAEGNTFMFRLRANPTRKICTKTGPDGVHSNGKRVPFRKPEEQIKWLTEKAKQGGFALAHSPESPDMPDVRIVQERDIRAVRSDPESPGRIMTFGGVVFEGRLIVKDSDLFRDTLATGIGSAKAFGFGLLSVAPIRKE